MTLVRLSILIFAIWWPRCMKFWLWAYFLLLSSMQKTLFQLQACHGETASKLYKSVNAINRAPIEYQITIKMSTWKKSYFEDIRVIYSEICEFWHYILKICKIRESNVDHTILYLSSQSGVKKKWNGSTQLWKELSVKLPCVCCWIRRLSCFLLLRDTRMKPTLTTEERGLLLSWKR